MKNIPVDVICMIDKTGKVTPLKIRIENADGSAIVTRVDEVIYRREEKYDTFGAFTYGCKVEIDDVVQLIELKYNVHECVWKISKAIGRWNIVFILIRKEMIIIEHDYSLIKIQDGLKVEVSGEVLEAIAHNYEITRRYSLRIKETDDGFSVYFEEKSK